MPSKLVADWNIAKDLYCNGMTAKEVAEHCGCSVQTVQKRATVEKWGKDRVFHREGLRITNPTSLTHYVNAQMESWVRGAIRLTQRITDLANRTSVKPDLKQLRDATAILESIVKSGRAMFNLDKQQDSKQQQTAILVKVDVEPVTQLAPSQSPQAQSVIDVQEVSASSNETANQMTDGQEAERPDPLDGQPVA
jgi:transposase